MKKLLFAIISCSLLLSSCGENHSAKMRSDYLNSLRIGETFVMPEKYMGESASLYAAEVDHVKYVITDPRPRFGQQAYITVSTSDGRITGIWFQR